MQADQLLILKSCVIRDGKYLFQAGNFHIDHAILNPRNNPRFQRIITGTSPIRVFRDGIAAHLGTTANINRFAGFQVRKIDIQVFVLTWCAARKNDQCKQDDHKLLSMALYYSPIWQLIHVFKS